MRFDIKMETVTKLQQKPRAMFTFICGQDFRRDQWESHSRLILILYFIIRTFDNIQNFRNVHSDIHGGLNNWIEARCPLSSYGCGFAVRRVFPGSDPRASLVYSQEITSFGVRPAPVTSLQSGGDDATDHGASL